jgi:hypothetical protein
MEVRSALFAGHALLSGIFLVLVNPRDIVGLEELGRLKTPITLSGLEPTTFVLVTAPQPTTLLCALAITYRLL